ncbi:MAG TPA: hypothetical protein VNW49_13420 [Puia sp.]|nr:hypothetical protein [Puia sp.]
MFKRIFFHGLMASLLTTLAATIYTRIYFFATETDFSKVLGLQRIIGFSLLTCMLTVLVNYGMIRWLKRKGEIIFNFLFSVISFACVMIPISVTLPLSVQFPELFPGLAVPMVFFPAIAWYTLNPLFPRKQQN